MGTVGRGARVDGWTSAAGAVDLACDRWDSQTPGSELAVADFTHTALSCVDPLLEASHVDLDRVRGGGGVGKRGAGAGIGRLGYLHVSGCHHRRTARPAGLLLQSVEASSETTISGR